MRFDGDRFREVSGLSRVSTGGSASGFPSLDGAAVALTVPAYAHRLEWYLRFERWFFDFAGDVSTRGTEPVSESNGSEYVSDYGRNFGLTITP
jgi:hypothetical protein